MTVELGALIITAASIGFFHTIFGPDHYLPFVMLSWARKWSLAKTSLVTLVCGLGHIASSVVLGLIGVWFGLAVQKLEAFESVRGSVAAWLLIAFGLIYLVWGLRRAYRSRPHNHGHTHERRTWHAHTHTHYGQHVHVHDEKNALGPGLGSATPWTLFIIFVFGPCEPLIPILMYPAAKNSLSGLAAVTCVFGAVTIATMLAAVLACLRGARLVQWPRMQRFCHAIAGATICLCGLAIQFLGL